MCLVRRSPIDWQMLIAQLRVGPAPSGKDGRSFGQIARATGISRTTLFSLSRSGEPSYQRGEALVTYWCQRMGLMRDCLPKVSEASDRTATEGDHSQVA